MEVIMVSRLTVVRTRGKRYLRKNVPERGPVFYDIAENLGKGKQRILGHYKTYEEGKKNL